MKSFLFLNLTFLSLCFFAQKIEEIHGTDNNGYHYTSYGHDPLKARIYQLDNGLKVYLSSYKKTPRIQSYVAVKAGSKFDPSQHTGLAHYLEHLMFKGTEKIGTSNWKDEEPLLLQIETLYEKYGATTDSILRKEIYKKIDSTSLIAASYAIPNEYDRILSEMGASGTNAYTSFEQTVYVNEIPSNELEKWIITESERFSTFVPRLFHTELETVYEEKNRTLDSDYRQMYEKLYKSLFPNHQYGTQTTIGTIKDLKSPSIKAIRDYFDTYYVPNNMAICLSGDLDMESTIQLIDQYFGFLKEKTLPIYQAPLEQPIQSIKRDSVVGPNAEMIAIGYRFAGYGTKYSLLCELVSMLLSNGEAGLIDINLNQKQLIQGGSSYAYRLNDYSMHLLGATPIQGQSLQDAEALLLEQIELLKKGDFEEWMLEAIVNQYKKEQIEASESNRNRAQSMLSSFIHNEDYGKFINEINELEKITKEDIVKFTNKYYNENYVVVYKKQGEITREHINKPIISELPINREIHSEFYNTVTTKKIDEIKPVFADYSTITSHSLKHSTELKYIKNNENELFELFYTFDFGRLNDSKIALAVQYLNYIGSKNHDAAALKKEFYKIGCDFNVSAGRDQTYISLSGLASNMEAGIQLFESFLSNPVANQMAYDKLILKIEKSRIDRKSNKSTILRSALASYAKYGEKSEFKDILSLSELQSIDPLELTEKIKTLHQYPHKVYYYGPHMSSTVVKILKEHHKTVRKKHKIPQKRTYEELAIDRSKVYFVDYDMVQSEVLMLTKSVPYSYELAPHAAVFNEYFGGNMSSIVFQEMREARALAYSVYSSYSIARDTTKSNYMISYIGTQSDKLPEALNGMDSLLNHLPLVENVFENSLTSLKKQLATTRTRNSSLFFKEASALKIGKMYDTNKDLSKYYQIATLDDVEKFHKKYVLNQPKHYLIIGRKEDIDWEEIKKFGDIEELQLEMIFGY